MLHAENRLNGHLIAARKVSTVTVQIKSSFIWVV